ncbi:MAG TPA: lysylphosphatidylglycerol synthase domain-containing protein [Actinomycetales bacterium]|nr:lysylphosphatidylglycerol synthase domain-containing protein [Actinomycetales bacterium]
MRSSQRWRWPRMLGGLAIVVTVLLAWGLRPFHEAARRIDLPLLLLALGIGAVTTLFAAWRWTLVAAGLGARLPLSSAVAGCYRSQLLNSTLPGGVLGDVHRGARHGPPADGAGLGLRTVWWERTAGQLVQAGATVAAVLLVPTALRPPRPVVLTIVAGIAVLVAVAAVLRRRDRAPSPARGAVRVVIADVRHGLLGPAWPGVLLASVVIVTGHWLTFVLAAQAAGSTASVRTLLPTGLLVLVASAVPLNFAGWGPREGGAAAIFGAAGLGASDGVTVAALYGLLALAATAPGLLVLVVDAWRRFVGREPAGSPWAIRGRVPVPVRAGGGTRG